MEISCIQNTANSDRFAEQDSSFHFEEQIRLLNEKVESQANTIRQVELLTDQFVSNYQELTCRLPAIAPGEEPLTVFLKHALESLAEKNVKLEQAYLKSNEAVRAKGEFLANVSHEIRTPMNGIMGMVNIVLDTELTDPQRSFMEIIQTSASSLLSVLNNVLDYSKLNSQMMKLEISDFSLRVLIEEVLQNFIALAEPKDIGLIYKMTSRVPKVVTGDRGRLRQVLTNLVGNAVKFSDQGDIAIEIDAIPTGDDEFIMNCSVADQGIGIDSQGLEKLFTPFEQADMSGPRSYEGTGLGLSICKELVELMGGRIDVESVIGEGTKFEFSALFRESKVKDKESSSQQSPFERVEMGKGFQILLAEDNEINQKVASMTLERLGYRVDIAKNGKIAVEMANEKFYDLICMDVQMPKMDGLEATRRIRGLASPTSKTKILAMTGRAFSEDHRACLDAGMDDFITKPIELDLLTSKLHRLQSIQFESNMMRNQPLGFAS